MTALHQIRVRSEAVDKPLPPLWGRVGMGGAAARSSTRILGKIQYDTERTLVRPDDRSCGGTPHPAPPKLTAFAKAPHPSPTRGEERIWSCCEVDDAPFCRVRRRFQASQRIFGRTMLRAPDKAVTNRRGWPIFGA